LTDIRKNIARIVTPTRTLYFNSLGSAFDYSDVMIEEHTMEAKDALSGEYVEVRSKWLEEVKR
jgi:hypothetical protein